MENKFGIVSGEDLIDRIIDEEKPLVKFNDCEKEEFFEDCFNNWQIDLRLGEHAYKTDHKEPFFLEDEDYLTIEPGEFALLITKEEVNLPLDIMGFISIRFKYKKMGLINISGFHVDPGYKGNLIFSVFNAGPNDILIQHNSPVFMIFFAKLTENLEVFKQKINKDKIHLLPKTNKILKEKMENESLKREGFNDIPIDMISIIQGSSVSLSKSNNRIEQIETTMKVYGSIAAGIIIALIGIIISMAQ